MTAESSIKESGGFTEDERKELFLLALGQSDGNVTTACELTNCTRREYVEWMQDAEFTLSVDDIAEGLFDNAEQRLQDAINDGNLTASIFFLKCRAKHRGYIERPEYQRAETGKALTFVMNINLPAPGGDGKELKLAGSGDTKLITER